MHRECHFVTADKDMVAQLPNYSNAPPIQVYQYITRAPIEIESAEWMAQSIIPRTTWATTESRQNNAHTHKSALFIIHAVK